MSSRKWLTVAALVVSAVSVATPHAHADPLTPLTPGEVQYLVLARQVLAVSQRPVAFRSDGELLSDGRYACDQRAAGLVGLGATYVDPVLSQLAFVHLCP